ncbi:ribitol 5-phosphate transferase FKRP-like [Mya arenaria]|uniref:ribitol 5-phosphate transferase FKRP-like n=1 Tax=Mya arenaria TaxID=6604 RepID=UPI0022E78D43|nr:ribitol 5-phosphate transferase FKRP-like [Mya arenaria]
MVTLLNVTMRILRRKWKIFAAALFVNMLLLWTISWCGNRQSNNAEHSKTSEPLNVLPSLTVIIQDFDVLQNDVFTSASYIAGNLSDVNVLIVSEQIPYPPVKIPTLENVKLVISQPNPGHSLNSSRPELNIRSNFVLFLPDGSLIGQDFYRIYKSFVNKLDLSRNEAFAITVDNSRRNCYGLDFKMKTWTLNIGERLDSKSCGYVKGDHGLLLQTKHLFSLMDPFMPSTFMSLYIQLSLVYVKVVMIEDLQLQRISTAPKDAKVLWEQKQFRQRKSEQLYAKVGVKKVNYANGHTEWYGCNKESTRCFDTVYQNMPEYLYNGRWTPPCCLTHLRETARHVFGILDACKARWWLEGGSLLGAARDHDIIPWDYDIDIGMYREDMLKCNQLLRVSKERFVDEKRFSWEKAIEGDFYRVQFSESNHLHVDIFPFYPQNGIMTKDTWFKTHKQDTEFPEHFLKPLTRIEFAGINASAPNNVREFLEYKFGKGVIESPKYPNEVIAF